MNRIVKQTIIFLSLLLFVSILELPFGSYKETLLPKIKKMASANNINLNSKDLLLTFPLKLTFEETEATIPVNRMPVSVFLNSLMVKIRPIYLLLLQIKGRFSLNAYLGELNGEFKRSIFSDHLTITAAANNFKLQEYPLLKNLSIKGNLNFTLNLETKNNRPVKGELKLDFNDGSYESEFIKILIVKVPYITELNLNGTANLTDDILNVNKLALDCSLGELNASARIKLNKDLKIEALSSSATIEFTEEGKKNFAGYLALAANIPIEKAGNKWNVEYELKDNKPKVIVKQS